MPHLDAAVDAWLGILRAVVVALLVLAAVLVLWSAFGTQPKSVPCYFTNTGGTLCTAGKVTP